MREVVSNKVMAAVVPRKTTGLFAAKRALAFLSEVGCLHGDLIVRSDQEPAITSLVNEVGRLRGAAGGGRFIVDDRVGPMVGWRGPYNPYRTRSES